MASRIDRKESFTEILEINGEPFDPRKHTLREYAHEYAKTLGDEQAKNFIRTFTGTRSKIGKHFAEYADAPLVKLLNESIEDETNPLVLAYQSTDAVNTKRAVYSQVKGLEYNISAALDRLNIRAEEFADGVPSLIARVSLPDKPAAKGARYQYDPGAVGKLQYEMVQHGKANPADVPVLRALAMLMSTGFRPGEVANMPISALVAPRRNSASFGIYLPTDTPGVKMDAALNVPAGPREFAIMQKALEFKASLGEEVAGLNDNMFVNADGSPITTSQMTAVLKKLKVPGIMFDTVTGKDVDFLQESYDLRRLHATTAYTLTTDPVRAAAARGRAIGAVAAGAGAEGQYISPRSGFYRPEQLGFHIALDDYYMTAYLNEVARRGDPVPIEGISEADWEKFQVEAGRSNVDILPPNVRLDYSFDMLEDGTIKFVEKAAPIDMQGGIASDFQLTVKHTGAPALSAPTPTGPASPEVLNSLWDEVLDTFEDGKSLPSPDTLKNTGKLGLVTALTGASFAEGMSEAEAQGYGTAGQIAGGVARTVVDVAEPVAVSFAMGQLGRPEDLGDGARPGLGPVETDFTRKLAVQELDREQATIAEQMSRIQQYDERQKTIDEQMSRISEYDKRNKPDIEIKYPQGE